MKLTESVFVLSNNEKFYIYHNLPETHGLSINDAFQNWIVRTKNYNEKSFVDYVLSKNTGYICMTNKQYKDWKFNNNITVKKTKLN